MNNTTVSTVLCPLCENSYFWVHALPVLQTSWLIGTYFQALYWYITEKSNSTESTDHFRGVKMLNYNRGPRPHKSNLPNHPIWSPTTPYVPLFLWWLTPIPLSPVWHSSPLVVPFHLVYMQQKSSPLNIQSFFQSTTEPHCYILPPFIWKSFSSTKYRLFFRNSLPKWYYIWWIV